MLVLKQALTFGVLYINLIFYFIFRLSTVGRARPCHLRFIEVWRDGISIHGAEKFIAIETNEISVGQV